MKFTISMLSASVCNAEQHWYIISFLMYSLVITLSGSKHVEVIKKDLVF